MQEGQGKARKGEARQGEDRRVRRARQSKTGCDLGQGRARQGRVR